MSRPTPSELIAAAVDKGGPGALADLVPVCLGARLADGYAPDQERTYLDHSMLVDHVVNPLLDAVLTVAGWTRIGVRSYCLGMGKDAQPSALAAALDALPAGLIYPAGAESTVGAYGKIPAVLPPQPRSPGTSRTSKQDLVTLLGRTPLSRALTSDRRNRLLAQHPVDRAPLGYQYATISTQNNQLYLKLWALGSFTYEQEFLRGLDVLVRTFTGVAAAPGTPVPVPDALALLDAASATGWKVIDTSVDADQLATVCAVASRGGFARPVRATPGKAVLYFGSKVNRAGLAVTPDANRPAALISRAAAVASTVAAVQDTLAGRDTEVMFTHPLVADVAAMAAAPAASVPVLRPYQNQALGVHLATGRGFVNACAPGLGKTVMTLTGMRMHARNQTRYRALVVCPAALRTQWAEEAARWFPEAKVLVARSRDAGTEVANQVAAAGDTPVLVITSYTLATATREALTQDPDEQPVPVAAGAQRQQAPEVTSTAEGTGAAAGVDASPGDARQTGTDAEVDADTDTGSSPDTGDAVTDDAATDEEAGPAEPVAEVLAKVRWHDLAVDEAAILRNSTTLRSLSLWRLRDNAERALALTGTPIDRSLDDLGSVVAWTRGDRDLFCGQRLAARFKLTEPDQQRDFADTIGPLVFRRDRSEVADELPAVSTEVVKLDASEAELRLATAARSELKRIYEQLLDRLEQAQALEPGDPRYAAAKDALIAARGAMLGGVTLARLAASDPAALLGSDSSGAALLRSSGLLAAATRRPGTKRTAVCELVADLVARGEKVLLFTDFSSVAGGLRADLGAAGVRVGAVQGGQSIRARDADVAGFQSGDLDALVCTSAGREGLNLQAATVLVHYDLPWSPSQVVQRQARANRIGATGDRLQVLIPIMAGTIEERVATLLVARSVTAMAALDGTRGADLNATEVGLALSGLVDAVKSDEVGKQDAGLLDLARELLAA